MVLQKLLQFGLVYYNTVVRLVGDVIVGGDNAAAKWDPPASRDGNQMAELSFSLRPHTYYHQIIMTLDHNITCSTSSCIALGL